MTVKIPSTTERAERRARWNRAYELWLDELEAKYPDFVPDEVSETVEARATHADRMRFKELRKEMGL